MFRTMKFKKCGLPLLFYSSIMFITFGCASAPMSQKEMRAYIDRVPGWAMVEKCGYENCAPMVDFLTSNNMTVRIEFDNDQQTRQFFMIKTEFITVKRAYQFNPSNLSIQISTEPVIKPKVFTCYYTIWDIQYLRDRPSLEGVLPIQAQDCYLLFIDHAAPSANDNLILNLTDAITVNGLHVDIPLIHFRKNAASP